ncbi:MAG: 2-oxo-4-hydroxy-4-carboxy-5-ureidoimidazoline decarboxylase [Candidatus Eisenbacteria bacterium]
MTLSGLDSGPEPVVAEALERCCGARAWVQGMLARRPYGTALALHSAAEEVFAMLVRDDLLEAFSHHPRIGEVAALSERFASTAKWASGEQSGTDAAGEAVLLRLARGNADYEARFGHVFIVCATGLTAAEMLARLQARIGNDPSVELRNAAAEQLRITHLRLDKLLEGVP